tara:strand:+ start:148 stop:633 length:486 start_codon:yes stop_codon:yes gene_type:complete
MIIGVDNGLDGGLCAISDFDGGVVDKIPMPTMQRSKKREVDARKINEWLMGLHTPFTLAVEEPLAHAKSSQAVRSMALSFGKIVGMAEVKGYDLVRVSVHKWQKEILGNIPKGMSKKFAMKIAESMAPEENWLKNKRCRKPHDGMVDAYLIAKYILTKRQK